MVLSTLDESNDTFYRVRGHVLCAEGVVQVDEAYCAGRGVWAQLVCTFRYGRQEDEVMGLNFYKELFLASQRIYPPPEKPDYDLSRTQVGTNRHWLVEGQRGCLYIFYYDDKIYNRVADKTTTELPFHLIGLTFSPLKYCSRGCVCIGTHLPKN